MKLGLTATPKRGENVDACRYFGDPVYVYSLKDGINDGSLTPFRVKHIQTTLGFSGIRAERGSLRSSSEDVV